MISYVPSVLFASTIMISNGLSCTSRLSSNSDIVSASFFTVTITLINTSLNEK